MADYLLSTIKMADRRPTLAPPSLPPPSVSPRTLSPPATPPPATPPPRLDSQDLPFGDPSPSKLFAVREEEAEESSNAFETSHRFGKLSLGNIQEDPQSEMRHSRPSIPSFSGDAASLPLLSPPNFSRPRNRSPYSRPNLRAQQSSSSTMAAPPMLRAHSSPAFSSPPSSLAPVGRSSSPLRSPKRARSPFRYQFDEQHPVSGGTSFDIESIDEEHELDITPRPTINATALTYSEPSPLPQLYSSHSLPLRRRRPASPLHQVSSVAYGLPSPSSASASPQLSAIRFNESFPSDFTYSRSFSSSSMPSTPTSLRSRSPSISSLETIPDTPDAEEEAVELDRVDKLRRVSECGGVEIARRPTMTRGGVDKRKRWSVCGGEKRSDLNLETIWED